MSDPGRSPPTVTCVIPTRNRGSAAIEAIDSVLGETVELEVVVVDDCSDDGSFQTLQERYAGDRRLVFIRHERRKGPGAARNSGVRAARGRYLTFLDDDDLNIVGRIAGQVALAQSENADLVISTLCLFETPNGIAEHGRHYSQIRLEDAWLHNPFINVTCLAESSLVKRLEFDESILNGEDWDLWVRCLMECRKSVTYPYPVIRYRRLGQASASRNRLRRFRARLIFLRKHAARMGPHYAALHFLITVTKLALPEPYLTYRNFNSSLRKLRSRLGSI